jgi:hypothetical protein
LTSGHMLGHYLGTVKQSSGKKNDHR